MLIPLIENQSLYIFQSKWERNYLKDFKSFIKEIFDWQPDYIVPVARKACKLLSSVSRQIDELGYNADEKIFYLEYFDFNKTDLSKAKIAIVDDVTRRSITLNDYRYELIKRGCKNENIRTYAFIGHNDLKNPKNRFDKDVIIYKNQFFKNRKYQEYVSAQSNHLLLKNFHADIDHLVIQTEIEEITPQDLSSLIETLELLGYYYELEPIENIKRFGIHIEKFPNFSILGKELGLDIENDFVFKIKFVYEEDKQKLTCIPIFFPKLKITNQDFIKKFQSGENIFPFKLPINYRRDIDYADLIKEKYFYKNVCLFFNTLAARFFYLQLKKLNENLFNKLSSFSIRSYDLTRFAGKEIADNVSKNIREFIFDKKTKYDKAFDAMEFNAALFPEVYNNNVNIDRILKFLRNGYKETVDVYSKELLDDPTIKHKKPHFDATVEEILKIENMHPLQLSKLIDELCDFGIMVPRTKFIESEKCWRRVYRSGENRPDEISWERTKAILAMCLYTLGEKQPRIYLEKVLANFTHDFPPFADRKIEGCNDNHSIYTTSFLFGPINQTMHFKLFSPKGRPFQFLNPTHIENKEDKKGEYLFTDEEHEKYSSLSNIVNYEYFSPSKTGFEKDNSDREYHTSLFSLKKDSFRLDEFDQVVETDYLLNYFKFFKKIYEKTSTVENVFALAIGRNIDVFKYYISYNIHNALFNIARATTELDNANLMKTYVKYIGTHTDSIKQKISAVKGLTEAWEIAFMIANNYENQVTFKKIWKHILVKKSYEDTILIAKEVTKYSENFNGLLEALNCIKEIIKYRCNYSPRTDIDLKDCFEKAQGNKFCKFKLADFFELDSNNEIVGLKSDKVLNENITNAKNNITSEVRAFVGNTSKTDPVIFTQKAYAHHQYTDTLFLYKKKKEFEMDVEAGMNFLSQSYGRENVYRFFAHNEIQNSNETRFIFKSDDLDHLFSVVINKISHTVISHSVDDEDIE